MAVELERDGWVGRVLGVKIPAGVPAAPSPGAVVVDLSKARRAWLATRERVQGELDKLRSAIVAAYAPRGLGPDLEKAYKEQVAWVLDALDGELTAALDAAAGADEAARPRLVAAVREAIGDYQTFLSSDSILKALDENPFTKPALRATLSATLRALNQAVV